MSLSVLVVLFYLVLVSGTCHNDSQCAKGKICAGAITSCTGSVGLAVNDNIYYNTISYASVCRSSSATPNFVLLRLTSVNGSVPTILYTAPYTNPIKVLAGQFNGVYLDNSSVSTHTLEMYSPGNKQISAAPINPNFEGYFELDQTAGYAYSCAFNTNTGKYVLNQYGGLSEAVLFPTPTKTLYVYPSGSTCGPSRRGSSTAIYLVSYANQASTITLGSTAATNSNLPSTSIFTTTEHITDFDVTASYIFYGTASGLFRLDLTTHTVTSIYSGAVTGVDAGSTGSPVVYFTNGTNIYSITLAGTGLKRLNLAASGTCQTA